jgi:hypothetical protein
MSAPRSAAPEQQECNTVPFLVLANIGDGKGQSASAFHDFP